MVPGFSEDSHFSNNILNSCVCDCKLLLEPMVMTPEEDEVEPKPFGDSRSSSPIGDYRDLHQPTISQTTYVKHRQEPTIAASSKQTHLSSSQRHESLVSSTVQLTEHETFESSIEPTESQVQQTVLPKFYRGPDETDNPLSRKSTFFFSFFLFLFFVLFCFVVVVLLFRIVQK